MALIKIPAVKSADYPQKPGYCLFNGTFKFTPIPFAVRSPSICRRFISAGCDFRLYRHLSCTRSCFSLLSGLQCFSFPHCSHEESRKRAPKSNPRMPSKQKILPCEISPAPLHVPAADNGGARCRSFGG